MSKVTIKLSPVQVKNELYKTKLIPLAKKYKSEYREIYTAESKYKGEDAAEELFDLTNNPARQEERITRYGSHQSISVGDIVEVDGIDYLCDSIGWVVL